MIAAFTIWNGRIAPVFDVAGQAILVDNDQPAAEPVIMQLPAGSAVDKLNFLQQHGVQMVICGATPRCTGKYAQQLQIELVPFIAGEQQQVIDTWLLRQPFDNHFRMPGCGRQGRNGRLGKQCNHQGQMTPNNRQGRRRNCDNTLD